MPSRAASSPRRAAAFWRAAPSPTIFATDPPRWYQDLAQAYLVDIVHRYRKTGEKLRRCQLHMNYEG